MEKSIGRWTITTKVNGGAEQRNEDTHSDMNETFVSVGLFVFFSSGKKQANKQTKKTTVYIPKGGGSIRLGASEAGI